MTVTRKASFSLFFLFLLLVGCSSNGQTSAEEQKEEIKRLHTINEDLSNDMQVQQNTIHELESEKPSVIQERQEDVAQVIDTLIHSVYTHEEGTYTERKDEASTILDQQTVDYFFPADDYTGEEYTAEVEDLQIFVEAGSMEEDSGHAMARFTHVMTPINGQPEETTTFVELDVVKEDSGWMVDSFGNAANQIDNGN